jgi:hypothetical protein
MRKRDQANLDAASLDELVEEITVDANGEDEQLWAFRQAFENNVSVPCEATVIGEPNSHADAQIVWSPVWTGVKPV